MSLLSKFAAAMALAGSIAFPAGAIDLDALWYDPAVPGRGLSIHDQNGVLFATLYTYDSTGKGIWYVASDVRSTGVDFDSCGTAHWLGTLYEARGPALGSATPPLAVREVGTLSLSTSFVSACSFHGRLAARVTIDGVATSLTLDRQTLRTNAVEGSYYGSLVRPTTCDGQQAETTGDISIARTGNRLRVTLSTPGSPPSSVCIFDGDATASGDGFQVSGVQECRAGTQSATRSFLMQDLRATENGFTAVIAYPTTPLNPACGTARIAGARRFGQ